jgi:nucleotide-binding universal stress UspA family protein
MMRPGNALTDRILVPLDGSELSEAILPLVGGAEHPWGVEVLLARTLAPESPAHSPAESEALAYLVAQARALERTGLRVRCEVWYGDPSQTIVNAAVRGRVSLIAMTTHGRRGLDRLHFGSVAESVVRKAPVPVLLVRGHVRWPTDRPPRILVPLDGSERSAAILPLVAQIGQPLHAVIELLHVLEAIGPAAYPDLALSLPDERRSRAAATDYLERAAAPLTTPKLPQLKVECTVLTGPALATITRRAADTGADLVAMSTHGRSGVARLLVGSVAEEVLRTADVPILLWKAPAAAAVP